MAISVVLTAESRVVTGRSAVRKLRATGALPGVIYGPEITPRSLTVDSHELLRTLHQHGAHPLVTVKLDGDEFLALVKEVQIDPVRQQALHVDFHHVDPNKTVQTEVQLRIVGEPAGVKMGGVLETLLRTVAIEALPLELPEAIEFDSSAMAVGDVARVGDLTVPPGVRILDDPDETVATVALPRVEEEKPALTPEELESLAALEPEELEALQELAEAAPEKAEEAAEGEEAAASEGGEESGGE